MYKVMWVDGGTVHSCWVEERASAVALVARCRSWGYVAGFRAAKGGA